MGEVLSPMDETSPFLGEADRKIPDLWARSEHFGVDRIKDRLGNVPKFPLPQQTPEPDH